MSNFLSSEYKVTNPPQLGDLNILDNVMTTLQGNYNANKALISQTLAAYNQSLQGIRDIDNEYIAGKLRQVKTTIDQYSLKNPNLAYNSNRDSIMTAISSVVSDPIIQNAIVSRQNLSKYESEVQKIKEKNPELVNDANYKYGLYAGGYQDYMQGKTNKLGSMQYTPYVDYNKKVSDVLMEFEKVKDDETIQIPDGKGGMTEVVKKGLTPDQLKRIAMYSLDANDNKQIAIDAWANSNMYTDENVIRNATSFIKVKDDALNVEQIDITTKLSQGGSSKQKAEWEARLGEIKNEQVNLKKLVENPQALLTYTQKEGFLNSVTNKFSNLYTESTKYVADDLWWKQANYDLNVAKFKYQQEKDAKTESDVQTNGLQTITTATVTDETIDNYEKQVDDKINTYKTAVDKDLSAYKSELENLAQTNNKQAQSILNKYDMALKTKQQGESDLDVFRRVVLDGTINENNELAIIGNKNYFSDIKNNTLKYDMYLQGMRQATEKGEVDHVKSTLDNDRTFKAFYNNPNTKMLWNGRATPVASILQQNGLMDRNGNKIGDLTAPKNKAILDELKKSYYADDFLSSSSFSPVDRSINNFKKDKINKLSLLFNESANNVLTPYQYKVNMRGYVEERTGYRINPNTKTGQYLLNADNQGIRDTFAWSDQSLSNDDSDIAQFVKKDYRTTESYKNNLQQFLNKLPENKTIAVPTTNKATYNSLLSYSTSVAESQGQAFNIDKNQGLNIRDISPDYIEVSQNKVTEKGTAPQRVQILKRDFYNNFPDIASKVDFESNQEVYSFDNLKDRRLVSSNVNFMSQDNNKMFEYATEVLFDTPNKKALIPFLTNQDSKRTLTEVNRGLIDKVPNVKPLIDKAIDESADFALNIEVTEGFKSPKLHLKLVNSTTGKTIHTVTQTKEMLSGISLDEYLEIFNTTPQVLYGTMLNDILKRQASALIIGSNDESFKNLVNALER